MVWSRIGLLLSLLFVVSVTASAEVGLSPRDLRDSALKVIRGQDGIRDYAKAYRLFCMAAALADSVAMHRLAWMYAKGLGVPRNRYVAMGWLRLSAARGNPYALKAVEKYHSVPALADRRCPLIRNPRKMNRQHIWTWAKLLGIDLGVDPKLVMAVIKTESNYNPTAVSPARAYGLMQLMPGTARRFSVDHRSPVQNMMGGVLYLRWLLRNFRGNVRLAVAAYNAGEQAVLRHRGIPPYKETRQYVRKVLMRYRQTKHPIPGTLSFIRHETSPEIPS